AATMTAWAVRRLRGAQASRMAIALLSALILGLVAGFTTILRLPGTSARQAYLVEVGAGTSMLHGFMPWFHHVASTTQHSLVWTVLTPGPVLGLAAGWILRRSVATPTVPIDQEQAVIRVVATALSVTLAASWILVTLGEIASYGAWWHLWPLWIQFTLLGSLVGWKLAAQRRRTVSRRRSYLRWAVSIVLVLWCLSWTAYEAATSWERRSIVDTNVAAARARAAGTSAGPVVWQAQPVGDITDMQADQTYWVNLDIALWFGLDPTDFIVVEPGSSLTLSSEE